MAESRHHTMGWGNLFATIFTLTVTCVAAGKPIICPPKISSFSAGPDSPSYYRCHAVGQPAVLDTCPDNQFYWARKRKCEPYAQSLGSGQINLTKRESGGSNSEKDIVPFTTLLMGRVAYLGDLYRASNDEIMVGESLWNTETISTYKRRSTIPSSNVVLVGAETKNDRLSHFDINAALKLDFLGGLISVGGSAGYLKDTVESENVVSVVMSYKATTHSWSLPLKTPQNFNGGVCGDYAKKNKITHVVSTVKYGIGANFIFKKTSTSKRTRENLKGSLTVAIKSIPQFQISGSAKVDMDGSTKSTTKDVTVKMYGDFVLDKQPSTFVDAIKVYQDLPKHLGEAPDYDKAAKLEIQLTPLRLYCSGSETAILKSLAGETENAVSDLLGDLESMKIKLTTLADSTAAYQYLAIRKVITKLQNSLNTYELQVKAKVQHELPKIRGGGADGEEPLITMLAEHSSHILNFEKARPFLSIRTREVNIIGDLVSGDKFKDSGIRIKNFESGNDNKVLYDTYYVLKLEFNILPDETNVDKYMAGSWTATDENNKWFNNNEQVAKMGRDFEKFKEFAMVNKKLSEHGYIFSIGQFDASKPLTKLTAYTRGTAVTYGIPPKPPTPTPSAITHDTISFVVTVPQAASDWKSNVKSIKLNYWKAIGGTEKKDWTVDFDASSANSITVKARGLQAGVAYMVSIQYVTTHGVSVASEVEEPIRTMFVESPKRLHVLSYDSSSFKVKWEKAVLPRSDVSLTKYIVTIREKDENGVYVEKDDFKQTLEVPMVAEDTVAAGVSGGVQRAADGPEGAVAVAPEGDGGEERTVQGKVKRAVDPEVLSGPLTVTGEAKEEITPEGPVIPEVSEVSQQSSETTNADVAGIGEEAGTPAVTREELKLEYTSQVAAEAATSYEFNVQAIGMMRKDDNKFVEVHSAVATLELQTKPNAPATPLQDNAPALHTATIKWVPTVVREGQTITDYIVKYRISTEEGTTEERSTGLTAPKQGENFLKYTMTGLAMGKSYSVSVKVRTTEDSEYSGEMVIETNFEESVLTIMEATIRTSVQKAVADKVIQCTESSNSKIDLLRRKITALTQGVSALETEEERLDREYQDKDIAANYLQLEELAAEIDDNLQAHKDALVLLDNAIDSRITIAHAARASQLSTAIVRQNILLRQATIKDKKIPKFFNIGLAGTVFGGLTTTTSMKACLDAYADDENVKTIIYTGSAKACHHSSTTSFLTPRNAAHTAFRKFDKVPTKTGQWYFLGNDKRGLWGKPHFCPASMKVVGFRVKKENIFGSDDKLYSAIGLKCKSKDGRTANVPSGGDDWEDVDTSCTDKVVYFGITQRNTDNDNPQKNTALCPSRSHGFFPKHYWQYADRNSESKKYTEQNCAHSCLKSSYNYAGYTYWPKQYCSCHFGTNGRNYPGYTSCLFTREWRAVNSLPYTCIPTSNTGSMNVCPEEQHLCGIQYSAEKNRLLTNSNRIYEVAFKCCRSEIVTTVRR